MSLWSGLVRSGGPILVGPVLVGPVLVGPVPVGPVPVGPVPVGPVLVGPVPVGPVPVPVGSFLIKLQFQKFDKNCNLVINHHLLRNRTDRNRTDWNQTDRNRTDQNRTDRNRTDRNDKAAVKLLGSLPYHLSSQVFENIDAAKLKLPNSSFPKTCFFVSHSITL